MRWTKRPIHLSIFGSLFGNGTSTWLRQYMICSRLSCKIRYNVLVNVLWCLFFTFESPWPGYVCIVLPWGNCFQRHTALSKHKNLHMFRDTLYPVSKFGNIHWARQYLSYFAGLVGIVDATVYKPEAIFTGLGMVKCHNFSTLLYVMYW